MTPMIAGVLEKRRGVVVESVVSVVSVEKSVVRSFGKAESMGRFSGKEGRKAPALFMVRCRWCRCKSVEGWRTGEAGSKSGSWNIHLEGNYAAGVDSVWRAAGATDA